MSQLFASDGQSIGVSASASVLPMNTQDCSPLGWTSWISLHSKVVSNLLQHHSSKGSIPRCSAFFIVQLSHPYMITGRTIALTRWTFVGKVMSLLFNMLSRLVTMTQDHSDTVWSTGEGNGKPLQYSCLENPTNSMKRKNDRILKEQLPRSVGAQYATGDQWRNKPERMKGWSQSKNNTQLWM